MTENQKLREAFEAYITDGGKWPNAILKAPGGQYLLLRTSVAWQDWKACAEALALPTAAPEMPLSMNQFGRLVELTREHLSDNTFVYKATSKTGDTCHFGVESAAKAWAKGGTVETIKVREFKLHTGAPTADHLPEVLARDIYQGLGYAKWENFSSLIKRCKQLIAHGQYAGLIEETERSVEIGSGAIRQVIDYKLDANAHQLVTSMASAFKLIGHYPSRNETSILSLIERWCKEKKISFVPQAKAIRGHVYDALVGDCVAVEFDEPHHIGSRQKTRDAKKDSESISSGIRVLRIGIDANIIDAIVSLESMLSKKMIETAAPVGERLTLSAEDVHAAFAKNFPKTRTSPIFAQLLDELREHKIKRRLKAAFRRKPKPARFKPQNEDCK